MHQAAISGRSDIQFISVLEDTDSDDLQGESATDDEAEDESNSDDNGDVERSDEEASETSMLQEENIIHVLENTSAIAESASTIPERSWRGSEQVTSDLQGEEDHMAMAETEEDSANDQVTAVTNQSSQTQQSKQEKLLRNAAIQQGKQTITSRPFPFAIIHTTQREIYLRQHAFSDAHSTFFRNPLGQFLPPHLSYLDAFTRLNLFAQIPELGLVILGSQVGRVAVVTLTRDDRPGHHGTCGMRLDWILPFKSQEREGARPSAPLIGLAVGPVQGFERLELRRRFRILLTYGNNSVLAYEVWRGPGKGENVFVY